MLLTCSAFNRGAIVATDRKAKEIRTQLRRKYGECMYASDIDEWRAEARYKVEVPRRALLPFYAALKRRRARRA